MSQDIENDDRANAVFITALEDVRRAVGDVVSGQHYNKRTLHDETLNRPPQYGDLVTEAVLGLGPYVEWIGKYFELLAGAVGLNADGLITVQQMDDDTEAGNAQLGGWGGASGAGGRH